MKKTLEQQYKEETGLNAYEPNNMRPNIPEDVYVEWLEDKIEQLALCNGSNRREQLSQYNAFVNMQYHGVSLDNTDIDDFNDWLNCN